jgi:hypothetical protein
MELSTTRIEALIDNVAQSSLPVIMTAAKQNVMSHREGRRIWISVSRAKPFS